MDSADRFRALAKKHPIIDAHNDFPYLVRVQLHYEVENDDAFTFKQGLTCHTDLKKLHVGGVGVQFFSCFIECKDDNPLYQNFNKPTTVVRDTTEQIDFVRRLTRMYLDDLKLATCAQDALDAFEKEGKLAIAMGIEGLHQVDASLGVLRTYFDMGVRYATLTHNCDNPFATAASSVAGGLPDKGLSDFGRKCVREMNRLGMMVDLSHVSVETMHDALEEAQAPVIFSHSSAFALTHHVRNVPDEVLEKVKKNGGVVCINFYPAFIKRPGEDSATIDDAVAHILHVANLIGWDHVGLGSDFDGIPEGPKGLEDVSKYPDLIKKVMEKSQATDEQVAQLMGGNLLRVWKENERVAAELKKEKVIDENWPDRRWEFFLYCKEFPEVYPGSYQKHQNIYKDAQKLDVIGDMKTNN